MKRPTPLERSDGKWVVRWRQYGQRPQRTFGSRREAHAFLDRMWPLNGRANPKMLRHTGMLEEADVAWVAGVMDSRGGWYFRRPGTFEFRMNAVDDAVLRCLCEITGSKVYERAKARSYESVACQQHCPEAHVHVNSVPGLDLVISGTRAAIVAFNVIPYMRVNDLECRAKMKSYLSTLQPQVPGGRKRTVREMHRKGWSIPDHFAAYLDEAVAA